MKRQQTQKTYMAELTQDDAIPDRIVPVLKYPDETPENRISAFSPRDETNPID